MLGCSATPDPSTEELIKTSVPTFSNSTERNFTTGTPQFTLDGECDPISFGLEYSYDQSNWTQISGGCKNSKFSIQVVVNTLKKVYVRAKTKMGYTASAIASIRLVLPPASAAYAVVTSGNAVTEGARGAQNSMGLSMTGVPMVGASKKLNTDVTGIVYGQ